MAVYRYLDDAWIDEFFMHGRLLLSTYDRCRTHEDLVRRDEREGKRQFHISHGNYGLAGLQTAGSRSHLLCASLLSSEDLMRHFGTTSYFSINNVSAFAEEVGKSPPAFVSLRYAKCTYVPERSIARRSAEPIRPDITRMLAAVEANDHEKVEEAFEEMNRALARIVDRQISDQVYSLKSHSASPEQEFRFVWTVDHDVPGPTAIECPRAAVY